ncbi:MAG: hypothetical protein OEL77_06775 [Nitrosopumilus sp.]|nr:hypothetical protein [Nitrosopumilus sp.]MDH3385699.1 hypothetical protein [Nitrosopumilus sp.]
MPNTYGQEPKNFGYKQLPDKLVEGTEGILQIYGLQKNIPIPNIIDNLIVTSSDQNIVEILELTTNKDTSITSVKLHAVNSGTADIAIAAPGFESEEFNITIYDIKQGEQKLLLKTVPDTFTINGPTEGYFSVELADIDSNPTLAKKDTIVSITTSNSGIITLSQNEIIIKEGEYFAIGAFQINNPGEVSIYAESENIESGANKITVFGAGTDTSTSKSDNYKIQLYVIPEKISNFATSSTFVIVQLQGEDGSPIKATENIPVSLKLDHAKPAWGQRPPNEISTVNSVLIPSGSSVGYAKLSVVAGLEEVYEVTISAEDYLVSDSKEFQTILTFDVDDPVTTLETIPLLASGSEELIGVLYPSDSNGVSLLNLNTVKSEINSSDRNALTISDDRMETGSGAKLIFGKMGQTKPDVLEITVIGQQKQTIFPIVYGPERLELRLISEPLISKVIPGTYFPMIAYIADPNNASWYFPDTSNIVMGPNEFVKTPVQTVSEGESIVMLRSQSVKEGKVNLEFEANEFTTTLPFETSVAKPTKVDLAYPDHLLSGMKNTLSLQLLDEKETPIFANKDIEFRIATNDNTIEMPQTVTIKKGTYHSLFDIIPKKVVETEISVLAGGFPLSKFNINTVETTPTLIISTVNSIVVGEAFDLVLDAKILDVPLENIQINWNVQGAQIQEISETTDTSGKIKLTLIADDVEKIKVQATTPEFDQMTVSKDIIVTKDSEPTLGAIEEEKTIENNIVFILVPGAVIGSSILLKRRGLLDPLADRFPIVESIFNRFDEILERLEFTERLENIKEKIPIIKDR